MNLWFPAASGRRGGARRPVLSLTGLIVIFLITAGCDSSPDAVSVTSSESTKSVTVRTAQVLQKNITSEITLIGTVTAIRRSIVGSPVEGRVVQVHVNAGDSIGMDQSGNPHNSDQIVQLDTVTISIEIASARAELVRSQHELAELKAGARPEELAQAKAQWEAAQAASEYAVARFRRAQELNSSNALSKDQFETAKSVAMAAGQKLIAAKAAYELTAAGARQEQVAQAIAKVEQLQHEITRLETQQRYHTIRAPFEGFIVKKLTEVGQWLTRGSPVVEMIGLDPIDIVVHVPETLVTQIRTGDTVPLTFDALPDSENAFEGTIRGIVASADQRARTFPVRIRLNNTMREGEYLLKDGMQARASISGDPRSAMLIPKDALILGGPEPVVMVARQTDSQPPVAFRVEVQAGASQGHLIEVRGALQPGQWVIVDGNERVQAGQVLNIVPDSQTTVGTANAH